MYILYLARAICRNLHLLPLRKGLEAAHMNLDVQDLYVVGGETGIDKWLVLKMIYKFQYSTYKIKTLLTYIEWEKALIYSIA